MCRQWLKYSLVIALLSLIIPSVYAADSQFFFNNVSGLGNAYSGEAAIADDASTVYFNPAGLSRIHHPQLVVGDIQARFNGQFRGTTQFSIPGVLTLPAQTGLLRGQATVAPFPFLYYSHPINNEMTVGFGISTPYGIGIGTPEDSIGRYIGTKAAIYIIDFSPALSYQVDDRFSAGLGMDFERLSFSVRSMYPSFVGAADSKVFNNATGWAFAWHGGILYKVNPATRAGLTYHSQAVFHPRGQSHFVFTPGGVADSEIVSNNFKFNMTFAPTTALSLYHDMNPLWALMGTIDFTQWSYIRNVHYYNIATPTGTGAPSVVDSTLMKYYRDSWRVALGSNYKLNDKWMLRLGVATETDPANNAYRSINNPGTGSISVAVGARYQALKTLAIDGGFMHFFVRPSAINTVEGLNSEVGRVWLQHDAIGLQGTWDFA